MYARFLAYLRLIDWCALSTSALILSACLWLTSPFVPQNNNQYESTQKEPDKKTAAITAQSVEDQIADYTLLLAIFTGILAISTIGFWLFGVVDYDDVFGQRHQVGYGRIFNKIAGDFVFIANDRYNYDRPRVVGKGNDWNQAT